MEPAQSGLDEAGPGRGSLSAGRRDGLRSGGRKDRPRPVHADPAELRAPGLPRSRQPGSDRLPVHVAPLLAASLCRRRPGDRQRHDPERHQRHRRPRRGAGVRSLQQGRRARLHGLRVQRRPVALVGIPGRLRPSPVRWTIPLGRRRGRDPLHRRRSPGRGREGREEVHCPSAVQGEDRSEASSREEGALGPVPLRQVSARLLPARQPRRAERHLGLARRPPAHQLPRHVRPPARQGLLSGGPGFSLHLLQRITGPACPDAVGHTADSIRCSTGR